MANFTLVPEELICAGDGARATGRYEGRCVLVVKAGSTAKGDGWTDRFLEMGIVKRDGQFLRFVHDYPFENPRTAADFILYRASDGWNTWKNASGQSLRKLLQLAGKGSLIGPRSG